MTKIKVEPTLDPDHHCYPAGIVTAGIVTAGIVTAGDLTWQPDGPVNEHLELLSVLVVVESHLFENHEC